MTYVCDYSWARPDPHAIKAAGFVAVCRYLSHDRTGKTLTLDEVARLHAAGLGVVLNFEDSATRSNGGYQAGLADAAFANALADTLRAPMSVPIYYSCDTDPGAPIRQVVRDYFNGLNVGSQGKRPVGVYGGAVLVQAVKAIAPWGWVANARSWDHGVNAEGIGAHLHQVYQHPAGTPLIGGEPPSSYDVSKVLIANFGQWGGAAVPAEEDDLPYGQWSALDKIALVDDVAKAVAARLSGDKSVVDQSRVTPANLPNILTVIRNQGDSTRKAFVKALNDSLAHVPGSSTVDADAIADAVAKNLADRLDPDGA